MLRIAIPIQQPRMRFYVDGKPLVGGKVYSYSLGTELFKPTFRSASKTALNQNPVVLDEAGSALIYMTGSHLLKVFDKNGNFIEIRYLPMTELRAYFYDMYGKPLKRGEVWTYDIASTIKKKSYSNPDKSESNINPVILDDAGSAIICMDGSYRLRVYDVNNVFQHDQDFQREPTFALTSKPYPLYFVESIQTRAFVNNTSMLDIVKDIDSAEDVFTSSEIENVQLLSSLNFISNNPDDKLKDGFVGGFDSDNINTSVSIDAVTQLNKLNILNIDAESTQTNVALISVVLKDLVVSTKVDPEHIETQVSVSSVMLISP